MRAFALATVLVLSSTSAWASSPIQLGVRGDLAYGATANAYYQSTTPDIGADVYFALGTNHWRPLILGQLAWGAPDTFKWLVSAGVRYESSTDKLPRFLMELTAGMAASTSGPKTQTLHVFYDCAMGVTSCGPTDTSLQGSAFFGRLALGAAFGSWEVLGYSYIGQLHLTMFGAGITVGRSFEIL